MIDLKTQIKPAREERQIATVEMGKNREMNLTFVNGQTGTVGPEDELIQAFAIWSIINPEAST